MNKILIFLISITFMSCASLDRLVVDKIAPVISNSLPEIETERNFDHFVNATPGELKFVEALLYNSPENLELLYTLTKSYSAYALLAQETLLLERKQHGKDVERTEKYINYLYQKAIFYGDQYFKIKGTSYKELLSLQNSPEKVNQKLDDLFKFTNVYDKETIFFFGQSLGSLVNMNKDRPIFTGQLPLVKNLVDYVCDKEPLFYNGSCFMFYGLFETSRPPLLGGNPEKGKEYFQTGLKNFPNNLFISALYLQFYLVPRGDKKVISSHIDSLEEKIKEFDKKNKWQPFYLKEIDASYDDKLNLFNAAAERRLMTLKQI